MFCRKSGRFFYLCRGVFIFFCSLVSCTRIYSFLSSKSFQKSEEMQDENLNKLNVAFGNVLKSVNKKLKSLKQ